MQRLARTPLRVGADFERGASMRVDGVTVFPHAMAFGATGDPSLSRYEGEVTAREARALGIQWVYYPVADVNNNPDNPIINVRSFGEDPADVAAQVRAFIEGAHADRKNYILTTAEGLPEHGDTAGRIRTLEPRDHPGGHGPAEAARAGALRSGDRGGRGFDHDGAYRGACACAPRSSGDALSGDPHRFAAQATRVSGPRLHRVLRSRWAASSRASARGEDARRMRAIEAGADTLLMPSDPDAAIKAVVAAVEDGRITRARLQESVVKILAA